MEGDDEEVDPSVGQGGGAEPLIHAGRVRIWKAGCYASIAVGDQDSFPPPLQKNGGAFP